MLVMVHSSWTLPYKGMGFHVAIVFADPTGIFVKTPVLQSSLSHKCDFVVDSQLSLCVIHLIVSLRTIQLST